MNLEAFFALFCILSNVGYSEAQKDAKNDKTPKWVCPCNFDYHGVGTKLPKDPKTNKSPIDPLTQREQWTNRICVGVFPLHAASIKGEPNDTSADEIDYDDPPDPANEDEQYTHEYVEKACENYGAKVFNARNMEEAPKLNLDDLPRGSLYFWGTDCAYIVGEESKPRQEYCRSLMTRTFFETVVCRASMIRLEEKDCTCPCGFFLSWNDTCIRAHIGCEDYSDVNAMYVLSYATNPVASMIARIKNGTEPPDDWPAGTPFFVYPSEIKDVANENAKQEDMWCGFKDPYNNGAVYTNTCHNLLNVSEQWRFRHVLVMAPMIPRRGECPVEKRGDPCGAMCRYGHAVINVWAVLALIWAVFSIMVG